MEKVLIDKKWIEFVGKDKTSDILHDPKFIEILCDVWKCSSFHKVIDTDKGKMGVPAYMVNKSFFGKKITSQPFVAFPKLLGNIDETKAIEHLISKAQSLGKNWYVEYKSHNKFDQKIIQKLGIKTISPYIDSTLFLSDNYEDQTRKYQRRFLTNIQNKLRKLDEKYILIKSAESEEEVEKFYSILSKLYRDKHRSLLHPQSMFLDIFRILGKMGIADFLLAVSGKEVLAGIVLLKKNSVWHYTWGASSLQKFRTLSLNTLLIDFAIRQAISENAKTVSFGTSSAADNGLLMYKTHWGCLHKPIYYHYWNKEPNSLDIETSYSELRSLLKITPLPIFQMFSKKIVPRLA
jgi:hypothetical protein